MNSVIKLPGVGGEQRRLVLKADNLNHLHVPILRACPAPYRDSSAFNFASCRWRCCMSYRAIHCLFIYNAYADYASGGGGGEVAGNVLEKLRTSTVMCKMI